MKLQHMHAQNTHSLAPLELSFSVPILNVRRLRACLGRVVACAGRWRTAAHVRTNVRSWQKRRRDILGTCKISVRSANADSPADYHVVVATALELASCS